MMLGIRVTLGAEAHIPFLSFQYDNVFVRLHVPRAHYRHFATGFVRGFSKTGQIAMTNFTHLRSQAAIRHTEDVAGVFERFVKVDKECFHLESQAPFFQTDKPLTIADYDVVKNVDVEQLRGFNDFLGHGYVLR